MHRKVEDLVIQSMNILKTCLQTTCLEDVQATQKFREYFITLDELQKSNTFYNSATEKYWQSFTQKEYDEILNDGFIRLYEKVHDHAIELRHIEYVDYDYRQGDYQGMKRVHTGTLTFSFFHKLYQVRVVALQAEYYYQLLKIEGLKIAL